MRPSAFVAALLLVSGLPAGAQQPRPVPGFAEPPMARPATPQPPVTRYFQMTDLLGDVPSDAVIKETRQGTRLTAATLDLCYPAGPTRWERLTVNLAPEGNRLVGTGQSQETKQPVRVQITRKLNGTSASFEGTIAVGPNTYQTNSFENEEQSEADYTTTTPPTDDTLAAAPENFAEVSANALALQVKREAFLPVIRLLKAENVRVAAESLAADCAALRGGQQRLRLAVDPERAPALVAKLKATPGVASVGWIRGDYSLEHAIRLSDPQWRESGKIATDKLMAALGAAAAKSLSATVRSLDRDATSGEVALRLKRPNKSLPELELSEIISITVLLGPEKPGATDSVVVWLGVSAMEILDDGPEPRLAIEQARSEGINTAGQAVDPASLLASLARELKGQKWSSDDSRWQ